MRGFFLTLLLCSACFADSPLTITPSGYFLTVVDADGAPSYQRIQTVIDLTGGDKPTPDEPDKPTVDKELAAKVQSLAKALDDPASSQAIAAVYAHIRGALADDTLNAENVFKALSSATDSALALIDGKDWSAFREHLGAVFTLAKQRGQLSTSQQVGRVLLSVQHGVEMAADGSTAITMDQVVEIARRTNTAIDGVTK